ncbi:MAG TPA: MHYT domain-containing protein [Alphaproteobacteria bacterium]|nr:MHYT domain-containing protein [Alphaproteobacteria bacterium]
MLRVLSCITGEHDLRLVVLAGLVCAFACYTAFSLVDRSRESGAKHMRWIWISGAAVVTGCGVWATHFVAMLAFQPHLPIGYDLGLTALSIAIAVSVTWLGLALALLSPGAAMFGGAIAGMAVGAMHFTGMAAMRVPARVVYDAAYAHSSLIIGVVGGALAFHIAFRRRRMRNRIAGAMTFALAICALHFTAMASVTLIPDPTVPMPRQVMAPEWLAVTVAAVTLLIVALGLAGSIVDRHLADRAEDEAHRLRAHVAELEETKQTLEATTRDLQDALEAAAAGSQAKSQFLATMSHELRTPLNAIIGFSEMLDSEIYGPLGDARYAEYIRNIRDSGVHLLKLINDVLDFSKLDAGRLKLQDEEVDIDRAVADAVKMFELQAADAGIMLVRRVEPGLPRLRADARRVHQVLLNLLSNAVKFTPAEGRVTTSVFLHEGGIAIAVTDTGIGIAAEDIPKALERFGQVDSSLSRRYEGTGLGLPLARRLMELHGGRLELESELGHGTTVTIAFPADRLIRTVRAA